MFKKTFIRLIVLAIVAFTSTFLLISALEPVNAAYTDPMSPGENANSLREFGLETFAGSILIATH